MAAAQSVSQTVKFVTNTQTALMERMKITAVSGNIFDNTFTIVSLQTNKSLPFPTLPYLPCPALPCPAPPRPALPYLTLPYTTLHYTRPIRLNSLTVNFDTPILNRFYVRLYLDIDECKSHNGHCLHYCHDTKTGFYCSCKTGYELTDDKKSCQGKSLGTSYSSRMQKEAESENIVVVEATKKKWVSLSCYFYKSDITFYFF